MGDLNVVKEEEKRGRHKYTGPMPLSEDFDILT
jgi:hypothetical protein